MSDWSWDFCPSCERIVEGGKIDANHPHVGCPANNEALQEDEEKEVKPESGDPRWCDSCRLVVKAKLVVRFGDGWRLECSRCHGRVKANETPEETTEKARVGATPLEAQKTCLICMKKVEPNESYRRIGGQLGDSFLHDFCRRRLREHGYSLARDPYRP